MPIPAWIRIFRRARRVVLTRWHTVVVVFRGNSIQRQTDFAQTNLRPVLLLQGFGSTRRSLRILEKRLRADGFATFSLRLGGLFGTLNTRGIDVLARHVLQKIASLRERFHLGPIAIIGHSKGGLIGRYVVSCLDGAAHVHTLVTLGTPHQGFPMRQLARVTPLGLIYKSLRQMRPASKLFRYLISRPLPASVRCVSIYSRDDTIVPPMLCALSNGQPAPHVMNIEVPGLSHSDYLIKGKAYAVIREYLSKN